MAITTNKTETAKPRKRRSPEQMIADHEAEIARIKERTAAKKVTASPEGKAFLAAVRAVEKAHVAAQEAGQKDMIDVLAAAGVMLGEQLDRMGVAAPKRRQAQG